MLSEQRAQHIPGKHKVQPSILDSGPDIVVGTIPWRYIHDGVLMYPRHNAALCVHACMDIINTLPMSMPCVLAVGINGTSV